MTLAHSVDQFTNPAIAIPTLIGLFLLGIVLGEAYILTGSVYFSIGLHCGFVLGAKMWPKIILNRAAIPWWIAGGGAIPLIGGGCRVGDRDSYLRNARSDHRCNERARILRQPALAISMTKIGNVASGRSAQTQPVRALEDPQISPCQRKAKPRYRNDAAL